MRTFNLLVWWSFILLVSSGIRVDKEKIRIISINKRKMLALLFLFHASQSYTNKLHEFLCLLFDKLDIKVPRSIYNPNTVQEKEQGGHTHVHQQCDLAGLAQPHATRSIFCLSVELLLLLLLLLLFLLRQYAFR